ncbi:Leucine-rich repeat-containing protein 51 [Blattella germanica]|nr:Leucine-rich repeat-containing protein 51 [Blattella germanica]
MTTGRLSSPPLDFSFRNLVSLTDLGKTKPRRGLKRYRRSTSGLYQCQALRLNNNHLASIQGIQSICYQVLEKPENLTWLDLSFNKLTSLSNEIAEFSNLKILYLHGNQLQELGKILKTLKKLPFLYNLTLHGNPLVEHKKYRVRILSSLPQLRSLDFTNVTVSDKFYARN